ncbi:MAG: LamG-like jellyroll fold domain-containing protein [Candidatus Micrarchaeaceae archaeon]
MALTRMKSNKGVLLTLLTIVLLVLMIAELITYVYLNIGYDTVSSSGEVAASSYRFAGTLNYGTVAFLHSSLYAALGTLAAYETPGRTTGIYNVNSTAYALQSLVSNGMLYGTNEITYMGGATLVNYTNSIEIAAKAEGLSLSITNSSLQFYQESPYSINVTYSALAVINSSSGLFTYPITASSSAMLNGSTDIYSLETGSNSSMAFLEQHPYASVVGNVYATSGSISPFQFIYGTVIVENAIGSCSDIPAQLRNGNYILAVQNDMLLGTCGFGGLVTYVPYSLAPYGTPYLVYSSASNVLGYIQNGTSLLLDGSGLSLLNIASVQSAIGSGQYFNSTFAPSYLDWVEGDVGARSQQGLYSFSLYGRKTAMFSKDGISTINTATVYQSSENNYSISLWIDPKSQISSYSDAMLAQQTAFFGNYFDLELNNQRITFGPQSFCGSLSSIPVNGMISPNTWHNIVATYSTEGFFFFGTASEKIYLDGVLVGSGSNIFGTCSFFNGNFIIGGGMGPGAFNGAISNVQAYNMSLSGVQASILYHNGIDGMPVQQQNLTGWWPLDGNADDYSGYGNNGFAAASGGNAISYQYLYGYTGDPIYGGSLYHNMTNAVYGAYNCANINQCSNMSEQHLYLSQSSLSTSGNSAVGEYGSMGLGSAVLPDVGSFNGNGYVIGSIGSTSGTYYDNDNPFSVSAWVYVNSSASGPIIDVLDCNLPSASCPSVPFISIGQDTIYANVSGVNGGVPISYTIGQPNTWHDVALTYSTSGTEDLYVDGTSVATASGTYSGLGGSYSNWTTACFGGCKVPAASVAKILSGKIADVRFYETTLNSIQVSQLYLNDSVIGTNPSDAWPLSAPYNGIANQTTDTANALNFGLFANVNGVCSVPSVINDTCGAQYSQP